MSSTSVSSSSFFGADPDAAANEVDGNGLVLAGVMKGAAFDSDGARRGSGGLASVRLIQDGVDFGQTFKTCHQCQPIRRHDDDQTQNDNSKGLTVGQI